VTAKTFWSGAGFRLGVVLLACGISGPAFAQQDDPAPYLHTHAHPAEKHKPKPPVKAPHVPVVSPRHPVQPRRPVHASLPPHKAPPRRPAVETVAKVVANPAPKKPAPPPPPANIGTKSGLPLPRYEALKSDDANMRSGPGERYPILWTYQRRDLPVKVEREFDIWRLVEDMDGIKGWMQQGFLTSHRTFVITGTEDRIVRAEAADTADAVADLKPGVVGRIRSCDAGQDWCQVQVQDFRGWLKRSDFWGVDATEAITP